MIIYKITNLLNGKVYVGQTVKTLKRRWSDHCVKSSTCGAIKAAINLYGKDNFMIEQIDSANSREELNKKEIQWIADLKTHGDNGYNLSLGGEGNSGYSQKPESVEMMRRTKLGKKHTQETKDKMSKARMGKRLTAEHKENISQSHIGIRHSPEVLAKISKAKTGQKLSNEHKEKIRLASLNRKHRSDSISKMSKNKDSIKKAIVCINTGKIYESINAASKDLGIHSGGICRSLKTGWQTHGYRFEHIKAAKYE